MSARPSRWLTLPLALAALAACTAPTALPDTHTATHPLRVVPRTETLPVDVASSRTVSPAGTETLDRIARAYHEAGQAPVFAKAGDRETVEAIVSALVSRGVNRADVQTVVDPSASPSVSIQTLAVVLPECGNFRTAATFDPTNRASPNWGCATQRNLGMMVANPADLVRAREFAPADAPRNDRVIRDYRTPPEPAFQLPGLAAVSNLMGGGQKQ